MHEATAYPGGRCRSYFDRTIGMTIDNGNHLVLSGNHAVLGFAEAIGSAARLVGPDAAEFPFVDLAVERALDAADQRRPAVVDFRQEPPRAGHAARRISAAGAAAVGREPTLRLAKSSSARARCIDRLVHPLLLAALNIEPREGSAALASAVVRETLARGGQACRPLIARDGLGPAFIEPAIKHLRERNVEVRLDHELRALRFAGGRIAALDFGAETVDARRRTTR